MKPFFIFITLITCFFSANAQQENDTIYFNVKWKKTTRDSATYYRFLANEAGIYKAENHYMNDTLQMVGYFSSLNPDIKDGYFKFYSKKGILVSEENYEAGKKEGYFKFYSAQGILTSEENYKDDKKEGYFKFYSDKGILTAEENFKAGKKEGYFKYYSKNGIPISEENYKADKKEGYFKFYSKNGIPISEENYKADKKEGYFKFYSDKGVLTSEGNYKNDKEDGEWKAYYESRAISYLRTFLDGKLDGGLVGYYEDGTLKRKEEYKEGVRISGTCYTRSGSDTTYFAIEIMPVFPGGNEAMQKFLKDNIRYPKKAKRQGIQGEVHVSFVVNKQGKVEQVKVIKGIHPLLDECAVEVVKTLPDHKPGLQEGKPVSVQYTLPVKFKLQ